VLDSVHQGTGESSLGKPPIRVDARRQTHTRPGPKQCHAIPTREYQNRQHVASPTTPETTHLPVTRTDAAPPTQSEGGVTLPTHLTKHPISG
jgi:hypothetical protein